MNCVRTEKLLALHAGGDLSPKDARAVSAHLQTCESCRLRADEFVATRELMRAYVPPEFDAEFFESVRRGVMREIKREPPPSWFASLFPRLFSRKALAYATSFALLVVAGTLALKLRDKRTDVRDSSKHSISSSSGTNNGVEAE
jgi:anti-sigma factor RsiW